MMARRMAYAVLALALIAAGADAVYWKWAADRMRYEIDAWVADRAAEGWRVTMARPAVSGWPLAVTADLRDVSVTQGQMVALQLPDVVLSVPLLRPTILALEFRGDQVIKAGDGPAIRLAGAPLSAQVPLPDPAGRPVTLAGRDLRVEPESKAWIAHVATMDGHVGVNQAGATPDAPVAFALQAEGVELPDKVNWPLGRNIESASVSGTLNGSLPPLNPTAVWASAWRDGGGSVDVKQADIVWGPLNLTSTATLALDDQLQPMGSGSAKASGYLETLDRMAKAGLLTKSAATVAKAMLSLLAGMGSGDAPPEVEVPLTLQYRTLSMRQVPLVRFPELDWPRP
jgi:hypothetical protein